jgi:hypothetical protein
MNAESDPTAELNDPFSLEERRFASERKAKEAELALREREVAVKESEVQRSRWLNPLVIGLFAAAIGLVGNIIVAGYNNQNLLQLERLRAQSSLIVQAISTGNVDTACKNLLFFITLGLLDDPNGTIRQCTSSPSTTPVLPGNTKTYAPAEDEDKRLSPIDTTVKRTDIGSAYKFEVTFTVPSGGTILQNDGMANIVSVYGYKIDSGGRRSADVQLPSIKGTWKSGDRATFSVDIQKNYVDDPTNRVYLRFCVGTPEGCFPSPNLLLPKTDGAITMSVGK